MDRYKWANEFRLILPPLIKSVMLQQDLCSDHASSLLSRGLILESMAPFNPPPCRLLANIYIYIYMRWVQVTPGVTSNELHFFFTVDYH